jgi:hypothetical protein
VSQKVNVSHTISYSEIKERVGMKFKCCSVVVALMSISGFSICASAQSSAPEPIPGAKLGNASLVSAVDDPSGFALAAFKLFGDIDRAEQEKEGAGVEFVRTSLKLDEARASAYVRYAKNALASIRSIENEERNSICSRRSSLEAPSLLDGEMKRLDGVIQSQKNQLAHGSGSLLGEADQLVVDLFIARRVQQGMAVVRDDRPISNPVQVLNFMCDNALARSGAVK